jgi:hypothetical protein
MKSYLHIRTLMMTLILFVVACNSTDDSPKVRKDVARNDKVMEDQSNSAITILDSSVLRSKLQNGDVYSISVIQGQNDTVFLTLDEVTPLINDKTWLYKGDGDYSNGIFSVPSGPGTYWKVYFTEDSIPQVQSGGGQYSSLDCICTNGGTSDPSNQCGIIQDNTGDGVLRFCCDGLCEGEQSTCAAEPYRVPFVLIKAEVLVLGNVIYTN